MKLVVIGFGQCGGRIADEFAKINKRARSRRHIEIVTGAFDSGIGQPTSSGHKSRILKTSFLIIID